MVAGPEVSRLLTLFVNASDMMDATTKTQLQEQSFANQKSFFEKVTRLTAVLTEMESPILEESNNLLVMDQGYC